MGLMADLFVVFVGDLGIKKDYQTIVLKLVAGAGFEPTTFGL